MFLEIPDTIEKYANKMCKLWYEWNSKQQDEIWAYIKKTMEQSATSLPPWKLKKENYGQRIHSYFQSQSWTIGLNYDVCKLNPPFKAFLEFVSSPYHELRHSEQYYMIALSILSGKEVPSGKSQTSAKDFLNTKQLAKYRFKQKVNIFEVDKLARQKTVQNWLDIPISIVQHADNNRNKYIKLTKKIQKSVIHWNSQTYGSGRQHGDLLQKKIEKLTLEGAKIPAELKKIYKRLSYEKDAFAIQALVENAIKTKLKKSLPKDKDDLPPSKPKKPPKIKKPH